jgi:hypothetical protein
MKKYLLFLSFFATLSMFSCSNDFEVAAPWKDIPVVYGLLDINDPAHYIRLEKLFLDPDGNALEIAKIVDSLYYQNATVRLQRLSDTNQIFTLQKVDGNDFGLPRDSGVFATEPNWLYRIDSAAIRLKPGERIRLRIDRGNGLPEITSTTVILPPIKLNTPQQSSNGFGFNIPGKATLAWEAADSAFIFDAYLHVRYAEYPIGQPQLLVEKELIWPWERGLRRESSSNNFKSEKDAEEFFIFMQNNIPVDETMKRIFLGIDVEIIAGGQPLENYVNVSLANTGITASQEIPTYDNLSEGKGIFDSVNKFWRLGFGIQDKTRDSLKLGYRTRALNF